MIRSLSFGSNLRYLLLYYNCFIFAYLLASSINLLTHYAKGTLLLFIIILLELLIKLLFLSFPSRYLSFTIAYISYLALEEGSPYNSNRSLIYLFNYIIRLFCFHSH